MRLFMSTLVFLCALAVACAGPIDKKFNITIGYLSIMLGDVRDRQGLIISGATTLALDELNNNADILPDVKILLDYRDTRGEQATDLITNMTSEGAVAFFGPEDRCYAEATVAQSKNLPMFSYKCAEYNALELPNFVKMDPTRDQALKSLISLLRYYRWNKFSIIFEDSWAIEAQTLETLALDNKMTVNHKKHVPTSIKLGFLTDISALYKIIEETKKFTRIYVYLGSTSGLRNVMSAMDMQKLFDKGEYMIIFVDMSTYHLLSSLTYITGRSGIEQYYHDCPNITETLKRRARSLLVVTSTEPTGRFQEFSDQVNEYDTIKPFYFPNFMGMKKHINVYGAYLYDSIKLYAKTLDELIKEDTQNEKLTYDKLISIATNGSRIVDRIISNSPYESVSGIQIRFNQLGAAEGSFSLLGFKKKWFQGERYNCTHTMVPVASFQHGNTDYPLYKINPRMSLDWPDNFKPVDEPACGYLNEKCATHTYTNGIFSRIFTWPDSFKPVDEPACGYLNEKYATHTYTNGIFSRI